MSSEPTLASVHAELELLKQQVADLQAVLAQVPRHSAPRSEAKTAKETAATKAVVLAARRVRMLKGGGDTMFRLAEALDALDAIEVSA